MRGVYEVNLRREWGFSSEKYQIFGIFHKYCEKNLSTILKGNL